MNGESGPGYQTGNASEVSDEPGAVGNRLSLDPNADEWKDTVGSWEDGKEYEFSAVKVRQISPGEFEVLAATPEAEADGGTDQGEQEQPAAKSDGYPNPAVANLMAAPKR